MFANQLLRFIINIIIIIWKNRALSIHFWFYSLKNKTFTFEQIIEVTY